MSGDVRSYPYKHLTDARSAMAETLAEYVEGLTFTLPRSGQSFKFAAVYDRWATFNDRAMSAGGKLPAATILPDRPVYGDNGLTPRALEDTWSGGDPTECGPDGRPKYPIGDGSGDGFVLFTHSELLVPFVLTFRAKTEPQRSAIVRRLEAAFIEDGSLLDPTSVNPAFDLDELAEPIRYGRLLEVRKYFSRKARFTLEAQQLLDAEASAGENRWLGQLEMTGHMQICVLRRVRAMKPKVCVVVDGTEARP